MWVEISSLTPESLPFVLSVDLKFWFDRLKIREEWWQEVWYALYVHDWVPPFLSSKFSGTNPWPLRLYPPPYIGLLTTSNPPYITIHQCTGMGNRIYHRVIKSGLLFLRLGDTRHYLVDSTPPRFLLPQPSFSNLPKPSSSFTLGNLSTEGTLEGVFIKPNQRLNHGNRYWNPFIGTFLMFITNKVILEQGKDEKAYTRST